MPSGRHSIPKRFGMGAIAAALVMLIAPITPAAAGGPQASLSATSLNFGGVAWLQSATQNVVLTNTGDAPLTGVVVDFSQIYVPVDFASISNTCPVAGLAPGAQCSIGVRFQPQSGGPRTAVMSVFDNAPDSPQSVALSGSGTGAVLTFNPASLLFPNVPSAPPARRNPSPRSTLGTPRSRSQVPLLAPAARAGSPSPQTHAPAGRLGRASDAR